MSRPRVGPTPAHAANLLSILNEGRPRPHPRTPQRGLPRVHSVFASDDDPILPMEEVIARQEKVKKQRELLESTFGSMGGCLWPECQHECAEKETRNRYV